MATSAIPGIKLIRHNTSDVSLPDDPSMPYKLEAAFRPPELFMTVAFLGLVGDREEIVVRGETRKALEEFVSTNKLQDHPRLIDFTITGPDGEEK